MRVYHTLAQQGLYVPGGATSLLIGTFPSVLVRKAFNRLRPTDVEFFYGSIDNNFWQDMGRIYKRSFLFNQTEEAVQQRKDLLDDLKMAMSDIILSCETTGSAMDTALQNIELNTGIIDMLDNVPTISKLYFTSSSGKVNAETLTLRMLKEKGRTGKMRIVQTGPRIRNFLFTDHLGRQRPMTSVTLISPSPLAEQWGGVTPEKRQALYQKYLPEVSH